MSRLGEFVTRDFTERPETRDALDGKKYIQGYFAVFNQETELWPDVTEVIREGAFAGATDVRGLINHNTSAVLGRSKAGTLTVREDSYGLFGSIEINEQDVDAVNLYYRIERGDVDQASFGGWITSEQVNHLPGGKVQFEIKGFDLREISPCTFPQYKQTGISTRQAQIQEIRDAEKRKKEIARRVLHCQKH